MLRTDAETVRMGAEPEVLGAEAVAKTASGRDCAPHMASIDGEQGAVWAPGGKPRQVFQFANKGDAIVSTNLISDPDVIASLNIATVDAGRPINAAIEGADETAAMSRATSSQTGWRWRDRQSPVIHSPFAGARRTCFRVHRVARWAQRV